MSNDDEQWMGVALAEAERGWGATSPNPLVGAVIVKDGVELGRGYHRRAGGAHAEIEALRAAGEVRGATLYATLEPCSTTGRTPPCCEALIEAGLARVVIGCLDANPKHAGRAVRRLAAAGIDVVVDVLPERCAEINEAFFHWVTCGSPFVILKMGMTLDGKIATAGGQSQWITGAAARGRVQRLRQWADAIMVGGETIRRDNPSLTVREPQNWPRQPRRIVWTREPSLPETLNVTAAPGGPVHLCHASTADQWRSFLAELGRTEVTALLVEGGGELAAALLAAEVVDKIVFFVAPKILGGRASRPVVGGPSAASLSEAIAIDRMRVASVGDDLQIVGYPVRHARRPTS